MKFNLQGIRKAAVLVSSLDRRTADMVLEQMDRKEAQLVREAMVRLEAIDAREQQSIIEEFLRNGPKRPEPSSPGIELAPQLARRLGAAVPDAFEPAGATAQPPAKPPADDARNGESKPFRFLQSAKHDKLVQLLLTERPQTIALVLSHLPPQQAGEVLVCLPGDTQAEVCRRLVDLEETDPIILEEVEQALQARMVEPVDMERRRVAGLSAVAGILEASGSDVGMEILDNLNSHDRGLADQLSPDEVSFDDLARCDGPTLATIVEALDPEITVLALVGASPEFAERTLRYVAEPRATFLRRELSQLAPTRLSDMEQAREQFAQAARRLAATGRITLNVGAAPSNAAAAA
jgi:flagellar motor switch protein FliG